MQTHSHTHTLDTRHIAVAALLSCGGIACGDDGSGNGTTSDPGSSTGTSMDSTMTAETLGSSGTEATSVSSGSASTGGETAEDSTGTTTSSGTSSGSSTGDATTGGSSTSGSSTSTADASTGSESSSETTNGNDCAPAGSLTFDDTLWEYYTTPNNTLVASDDTEITMIPDDVGSVGAAIVFADGLQMPYTIAFEYWILDDDGAENGNVFSSADGVALAVAKDPTPYLADDPPNGGTRGIFDEGTGYAVDFALYENRTISVRDGNGDVVAGPTVPVISTYPHGQWRTVSIEVTAAGIEVTYEGAVELTYSAVLDESFDSIVLGAATGGSDGEHRIRNVQITCP